MDCPPVDEILKQQILQDPRVPPIQRATGEDRADFVTLWAEYVVERGRTGGLYSASPEQLGLEVGVFDAVMKGTVPGLSLLIPGVAVNLWAIEVPIPTRYGRIMIGHGTYVRPDYRGHGIAGELARVGLRMIRELGFDGLLASYDVGNRDGKSFLEGLAGIPVQVSQVLRA